MSEMYDVLLVLLTYLQLAVANVEKVIFLGPSSQLIPTQHPTIEGLQLHTLSSQSWTIRTKLQAEFPTNTTVWGEASWVLLDYLSEGQRYEVRICWAATQPTSFRLDTYELHEVFDSPELIASLAKYAETRQCESELDECHTPSILKNYDRPDHETNELRSILLLRVLTAADYYTTNKTLMEHVPPVLVDIILDPYLLNVFPRSLLPTGVYLIIIAISSWYLANFVARWLQMVVRINEQKKDD